MFSQHKYFFPLLLIVTFFSLLPLSTLSNPMANAILEAIKNDDIKTIQALASAGTDFNIFSERSGVSPLYQAAQYPSNPNSVKIIEIILNSGGYVNISNKENSNGYYGTGQTPLHNAAEMGHYDAAKVLLDRGADPNITDKENRTPLMLAVAKGHSKIVQLLVSIKK